MDVVAMSMLEILNATLGIQTFGVHHLGQDEQWLSYDGHIHSIRPFN